MFDTASEHSSLDTLELGGRLSQLSRAKGAVALNSVRHVRMRTTYELEEHVTVYVLDVFLQATPKGLPTTTTTTTERGRRRHRRRFDLKEQEPDAGPADYQVEHRYSAFRTLRARVRETVAAAKDKSHPYWCPYCARVRALLKSAAFPCRVFHGGRLTPVPQFLSTLLVRRRAQRLGAFVNELLRAAKDVSYRSGCRPCDRFEAVSRALGDFFTPATTGATGATVRGGYGLNDRVVGSARGTA